MPARLKKNRSIQPIKTALCSCFKKKNAPLHSCSWFIVPVYFVLPPSGFVVAVESTGGNESFMVVSVGAIIIELVSVPTVESVVLSVVVLELQPDNKMMATHKAGIPFKTPECLITFFMIVIVLMKENSYQQ